MNTDSKAVANSVDPPSAARLARLSFDLLDRLLVLLRSTTPDPRLSYPRLRMLTRIERAGTLSMGEFASGLGIARSTASELFARLFQEGLVTKKTDSDDARSVLISLSPLGQRLVRRRTKELLDAQRRLLSRLSAEDQEAFLQALETLERLARKVIPFS